MKKLIAIAMIAVSVAGALYAFSNFTDSKSTSATAACGRRTGC